MQIHNLSTANSVLNHFIAQIRDVQIQKDSMRFRRNLERIGEVLGYEMSKKFGFNKQTITTPLGVKNINFIENEIVLCSILRAGLPLHQGLLNYFDAAENAFISAYRHHCENANSFEILVEYLACPTIAGKTLVLADPMLATGQSMVATFEALKPFGKPKNVHLVSAIASQEGLDFIGAYFNTNVHFWVADIDANLNQKGYIIPGLGDAGDLAFGSKLQH